MERRLPFAHEHDLRLVHQPPSCVHKAARPLFKLKLQPCVMQPLTPGPPAYVCRESPERDWLA
ncbi:hypothetical protein FHE65_26935 [Mumia zhuanghuii]|uniref:Uncharacterized protein n=1 Tax=Mumia zhuanghuii TaxID=2585211 RepID=A0A5C4MGL0_9ACTN|nr:hypothetical protein FHE65_26935 [Mumia zhuanghuii]